MFYLIVESEIRKDHRNIEEVYGKLADGVFVDKMAEQAYQDIIASGNYPLQVFIGKIDDEIEQTVKLSLVEGGVMSCGAVREYERNPSPVTTFPVRNELRRPNPFHEMAYLFFALLPESTQARPKPAIKRLMGKV